MKLTDSEKRDAIKLIEAGKPLPDKYRFLLFDDKREVELIWNGKTNEVTNIVLPFQVIEQIDEPRQEQAPQIGPQDPEFRKLSKKKKEEVIANFYQDSLFDARGRQQKGWTNKLIWGDNKLILSSLKNGPLRDEIERTGGIKLIYIDPPFDVGADFSMDIEIGDEKLTKEPGILEEIAYRDTWGRGADSFISMIYERLVLMRDLLAEDGSIYVHCDWRVNSHIRLIMDEIFGSDQGVNEITWKCSSAHSNTTQKYDVTNQVIYFYSKNQNYTWNLQYGPYDADYVDTYYRYKEEDGRRFKSTDLTGRMNQVYEWKGVKRPWAYAKDSLDRLEREGKIFWTRNGIPRLKQYLDEMPGIALQTIWSDINPVKSWFQETVNYPTQKPEALLERIVKASSNEGDIIADFFTGSGTTAAVAEKLKRKWIVSDLGKFAIHTTRKRMIQVQRQLKDEGKDFRAFELLNLGKYERQHYVGINENLREAEEQKQIQEKEKNFIELILHAYKAQSVEGFPAFHGKKAGRLVAVGPINLPVTRLFVEELILECRKNKITRIDVLAFEFAMGLFPNILDEAKQKGIDIAPKYIPREVFDKRAIEKNQVVFHDVSYIEIKPHVKTPDKRKKDGLSSVAVELTDFSVYYTQETIDNVAEGLTKGKSKVTVDNGQIVKVSKNNSGVIKRDILTKKWTDWIDYWSVDFDFESKREIIRNKNEETGEIEEKWTGDYIFENEWQSFRTKKDRSLELKSVFHECKSGRYKIAVKVVDIFGNDTMRIIEVQV